MVSVYLWILFIICWIIGILMLFMSAKTLVDDSNDGSISYIICLLYTSDAADE